jgi:hypothetical protein
MPWVHYPGAAAKKSRKIQKDGEEPKNCVTIEGFAAHKAAFARKQKQAMKRFLRISQDRNIFKNLTQL